MLALCHVPDAAATYHEARAIASIRSFHAMKPSTFVTSQGLGLQEDDGASPSSDFCSASMRNTVRW